MKQHNNTAYVNVRGMSDWEFTEWTGGWTREQAQACMMRNRFSPLPARAMVQGAKMSTSEPGRVWVENFQRPLGGGWRCGPTPSWQEYERFHGPIDAVCGEIGQ